MARIRPGNELWTTEARAAWSKPMLPHSGTGLGRLAGKRLAAMKRGDTVPFPPPLVPQPGQWALNDSPSAGADKLDLVLVSLPSSPNSPVTQIWYQVNALAPVNL